MLEKAHRTYSRLMNSTPCGSSYSRPRTQKPTRSFCARSATTSSRTLRAYRSLMCVLKSLRIPRWLQTGHSLAGTVVTWVTLSSSVRVSWTSHVNSKLPTLSMRTVGKANGGATMQQVRCWKPSVWFIAVPLLLLLVLARAEAQAPAASGKAKVDRLVMGLITPYLDYVRPWINGNSDHNIVHDPAFEWLIEVDAETGQYKPWLATSWDMAQDGKSWRVKLQKGVQFHHSYGEFTAKDVVHTHALWCDENYQGRKDLPSSGYRAGICAVERIEVVSDYDIVMHCKGPCLDMPFYYSSASDAMIFSKAQWDKEGEMAYETKPAGTGPYALKEQQLGC